MSKINKHNLTRRQKFQLCLSLAALLFLCLLMYFIGRPLIAFVSEPEQFQSWVKAKGFWGILAFMGMNILQVFLAVIPGGPFEIGAGYAFGVLKGALICDIATTCGSLLIFLLVRRFGMKFVELFVSQEKIESTRLLKSSTRSESIIFLLFLIPGTPKDLMSYLVGLTDMKLSHWIFICAVGRFPAIFLSALSGSALGAENYTAAVVIFSVLAILYVIGLLIYQFHNRASKKDSAD